MSRGAAQPSCQQQPSSGTTALTRPSLAEFYAQHFRYVWRCLRSLGVRDWALDDTIQDLFLIVEKKLPDFDGQVSATTWLYAIAIRVARRHKERAYRDLRRHAPEEALDQQSVGHARDTSNAEHNERLRLAGLALESLDEDKREVFVLSQIEQLSAPEIAAIIGIPLNTVYSRLRASRAAFAAEIQRLETGSRRPS
jgi:RNA polymerase sigma-70 factor (ECF subfamily)